MNLLEQAESYIQTGEFKKAESILVDLIAENPDDLQAICDIGIVYTETGKSDQAIRALKHYLDFSKENHAAWEALGCSYFRQKRLEEAEDCFIEALRIRPNHPSVLRNLGVLYGVKGDRQKGYEMVQRSYYLKSDDFRTIYALSYIHKEFGFRNKAREAMGKLMKMALPEEIRKDTVLNIIKHDLNWE